MQQRRVDTVASLTSSKALTSPDKHDMGYLSKMSILAEGPSSRVLPKPKPHRKSVTCTQAIAVALAAQPSVGSLKGRRPTFTFGR